MKPIMPSSASSSGAVDSAHQNAACELSPNSESPQALPSVRSTILRQRCRTLGGAIGTGPVPCWYQGTVYESAGEDAGRCSTVVSSALVSMTPVASPFRPTVTSLRSADLLRGAVRRRDGGALAEARLRAAAGSARRSSSTANPAGDRSVRFDRRSAAHRPRAEAARWDPRRAVARSSPHEHALIGGSSGTPTPLRNNRTLHPVARDTRPQHAASGQRGNELRSLLHRVRPLRRYCRSRPSSRQDIRTAACVIGSGVGGFPR